MKIINQIQKKIILPNFVRMFIEVGLTNAKKFKVYVRKIEKIKEQQQLGYLQLETK